MKYQLRVVIASAIIALFLGCLPWAVRIGTLPPSADPQPPPAAVEERSVAADAGRQDDVDVPCNGDIDLTAEPEGAVP